MACRLLVMGTADRVLMANATQHAKPMGSSAACTAPPGLGPANIVGQERSSLAQSRHAGGGLPDDCALLQSAVEIPETDDGQ